MVAASGGRRFTAVVTGPSSPSVSPLSCLSLSLGDGVGLTVADEEEKKQSHEREGGCSGKKGVA